MPSDPEAALALALHAVDDDVQFIRRDARNFPVLSARILAASQGPGLDEPPLTDEQTAYGRGFLAGARWRETHPASAAESAKEDGHG